MPKNQDASTATTEETTDIATRQSVKEGIVNGKVAQLDTLSHQLKDTFSYIFLDQLNVLLVEEPSTGLDGLIIASVWFFQQEMLHINGTQHRTELLNLLAKHGRTNILIRLQEHDNTLFKSHIDNCAPKGSTPIGSTPIEMAIQHDHPHTCSWLLQQCANVQTQKVFSRLVFLAAFYGSINALKALNELNEAYVKRAQLINSPWSPLSCAIKKGHPDTASWLLHHGANVAWTHPKDRLRTLVHKAAERGYTKVLEILQEFNGPYFRQVINQRDTAGGSPLAYAVGLGHADTASWLLNQGADEAWTDTDNGKPLLTLVHLAAKRGHTKVLEILQEFDGPYFRQVINQRDTDGCTPFFYALKYGHADTASWLLQHGADITWTHPKDHLSTLVHMTVGWNRIPALKVLYKFNAHFFKQALNQLDAHGASPLLIAAKNGYANIVSWLLEQGGDITWGSRIDPLFTLVHCAAKHGHVSVLVRLKEFDEPYFRQVLNQADNYGRTPLSVAVEYGHANTASWLLQNGAKFTDGTTNQSEIAAADKIFIDKSQEPLDQVGENQRVQFFIELDTLQCLNGNPIVEISLFQQLRWLAHRYVILVAARYTTHASPFSSNHPIVNTDILIYEYDEIFANALIEANALRRYMNEEETKSSWIKYCQAVLSIQPFQYQEKQSKQLPDLADLSHKIWTYWPLAKQLTEALFRHIESLSYIEVCITKSSIFRVIIAALHHHNMKILLNPTHKREAITTYTNSAAFVDSDKKQWPSLMEQWRLNSFIEDCEVKMNSQPNGLLSLLTQESLIEVLRPYSSLAHRLAKRKRKRKVSDDASPRKKPCPDHGTNEKDDDVTQDTATSTSVAKAAPLTLFAPSTGVVNEGKHIASDTTLDIPSPSPENLKTDIAPMA